MCAHACEAVVNHLLTKSAAASSIFSGVRLGLFPCIVPPLPCTNESQNKQKRGLQQQGLLTLCCCIGKSGTRTPPRPPSAAATSLWIGSVQPLDTTKNFPSPPFFVQTPQLRSITNGGLPSAAVVVLTAPATVCRKTMSASVL